MRRLLLTSCAVLAMQAADSLPAVALTTPEPMRPKEARGDERIRQVWWRPGVVIKLAGAEGQSLIVEMPKGMKLQAFMFSQQNIIRPEDYIEVDPATGKPIPPPPMAKEEGCESNVNIKICVRLERFLFFIPYVSLTVQPFPMILIEKKKSKTKEEEIEHSIVFELSTVPPDQQPYYGVKVLFGDPPEPLPEPPPEPVAPPPAVVPKVEPKPEPRPKPVPMARVAPAVSATPAAPPIASVAEAAPSVSRETETAEQRANRDVAELLANRQNRVPIVPIPPRAGMSDADKRRLKELEMLALQPINPPTTNNQYTIQGDKNLLGR